MAAIAAPWWSLPAPERLSDADIEVVLELAPDTNPDVLSESELPTVRDVTMYDDGLDYDDQEDRTLPSVPVPVIAPVVPREAVLNSARLVALCGAWALAGMLMGVAMMLVGIAGVTL
jgi:hypothetical protein